MFMRNLAVLTTLLVSCGCATVVTQSSRSQSSWSQTTWPVRLTSSPEGAKVTITNKAGAPVMVKGKHGTPLTTPDTVQLPGSASLLQAEKYTFEFKKEGYQPKTVVLDARINKWFYGNAVFIPAFGLGFLLFAVDPVTGAMWELDEKVKTTLAVDETAKDAVMAKPATAARL